MIDINELVAKWEKSAKTLVSFEEIMNKVLCLDRDILIGDITYDVGEAVNSVIRYWNILDDAAGLSVDEREPIKLYIDSHGGDLIQAFVIIDSIKLSKTPVWTIGMGAVYSGGFFIFIAGDKRIAYPHASFLYHEGSTGMGGDAGKFRNYAAFYEKQLSTLKSHTLTYTKIDEATYDKHIKDDWWLLADEALDWGICDEIAESF